MDMLDRIDSELVNQSPYKMKPKKVDLFISHGFDLLINAPQDLMDHFVSIIHSIFIQREVLNFLLRERGLFTVI